MTVVVYRDSSGINNKDHLVHYSYRNEHMPSGEIGVTVKNFKSTVDRCNEAETKNLSAIANRPGWNLF